MDPVFITRTHSLCSSPLKATEKDERSQEQFGVKLDITGFTENWKYARWPGKCRSVVVLLFIHSPARLHGTAQRERQRFVLRPRCRQSTNQPRRSRRPSLTSGLARANKGRMLLDVFWV